MSVYTDRQRQWLELPDLLCQFTVNLTGQEDSQEDDCVGGAACVHGLLLWWSQQYVPADESLECVLQGRAWLSTVLLPMLHGTLALETAALRSHLSVVMFLLQISCLWTESSENISQTRFTYVCQAFCSCHQKANKHICGPVICIFTVSSPLVW